MSKKYETKEKEVCSVLNECVKDLNKLFFKNESGDYVVPTRMQLICIFTIIDVLANYWYEYIGKNGTPKERFKKFVKEFCFTNDNSDYVESKYLSNVGLEDFYKFRSSLVHFCGIAVGNFFIAPNFSDKFSKKDLDFICKKYEDNGVNVVPFQPFELKKVIIEGAIIMFEKIQEDQDSKGGKKNRVNGIKRIHEKIKKEGAFRISKDQFLDKSNTNK